VNPPAQRSRFPRLTAARPWLVAWVLLVASGVAVHWALWIAPRLDPPIDTFTHWGWLTRVSNVTSTFGAPGMIATTRVVGRLFPLDLLITTISYGLAWAIWLTLLWALVRAARKLAAPASRASGPSADAPPNPGRRRLIVGTAFAGGAAASSGTVAYAALVEPFRLGVTRYTVPIRGWPIELAGFRAVFIADTHLGPRVPAEHIRHAYELARDLKPDLLLFGGDYIHNGARYIQPAAALMRDMLPLAPAPLTGAPGTPALGVLGNHDWYADGPAMAAALNAIGVRTIDNARLFLDARTRTFTPDQPAGPCVCFAGVGDAWEGRVDYAAALADVRAEVPRIVLSHQPDTAEDGALYARNLRVDLILSGHTHGGQVRLPLLGTPIVPSRFGQRYAYGLNPGPHCPVLTTSGVGMSIVPLRLSVPPEIVEITFTRAEG
jgi:predicted MPP superfamily phosphohydrolase